MTSNSLYALPARASPLSLAAERVDDGEILLTWEKNLHRERVLVLQRSTNHFITFKRFRVRANAAHFLDRGLEADVTYSYRARTWTRARTSRFSTTNTVPPLPPGPISVRAEVGSSTEVLLSWDGLAAEAFLIERSTNGLRESTIAVSGATSYTDTNITPGLAYSYRVRVWDAPIRSRYSTAVFASTGTLNEWQPVFRGIDYAKGATLIGISPTQVVNVLRIDLTAPGIQLMSTPRSPDYVEEFSETRSMTTSHFIRALGVQAAINGNWFFPCCSEIEGTPTDLWGLAMSSNTVVSSQRDETFSTSMFFTSNNWTTMLGTNWPPVASASVWTAVSGKNPLLYHGEYVGTNVVVAPRSALGLSADRRYLFLLVIDGRQPGYSEGASDLDTAAWLRRCGAYDAMMLDGGGSSTLAISDAAGGALVLNRPIHAGVPGLERAVGNHLGVYATPLAGPFLAKAASFSDARHVPVVPARPVRQLVVTVLDASGHLLAIHDLPDCTFRVEWTDDLIHPEWHTSTIGRADETGAFSYIDRHSTGARFYRTIDR